MSKELEALEILNEAAQYGYGWGYDVSALQSYLDLKAALNELEDAKHNYKALKEMYNNAVAYATEIQEELNELKKRNEPMKIISFDASSYYGGLGYFKCPNCGEILTKGYYNYCPECGQKLDWSDEDE